jgi:hypothetical protein
VTEAPESWTIGNDHIRFGRGPSGAGPAQLAPRLTAYLALWAVLQGHRRAAGPNGASRSTTSPSIAGCSGSPRCWLMRPGPAGTRRVIGGSSMRRMSRSPGAGLAVPGDRPTRPGHRRRRRAESGFGGHSPVLHPRPRAWPTPSRGEHRPSSHVSAGAR